MNDQRERWAAILPQLPPQLWLLAAAAFVNFLGFMVAPFLVLYLTEVVHMPVQTTGVLLTAFGIGGLAGTWAGGRLSDGLGARNVLGLGLLSSAAAMAAIPQASGTTMIGATLVALGFSAGSFRPAYDSAVVGLCPEQERSRAYAVYVVAINAGAGVATSIGGYLYAIKPYLILYVDAASSVFAAILILFFLVDPIDRSRETRIEPENEDNSGPAPCQSRAFLLSCLASCVIDFVSKQTSVTLPLYVTSYYGMTAEAFGQLLTVGYVLFAAAILPVSGWVKRRNQQQVVLAGMFIVALAFLLLPIGSGALSLVTLYLLLTLGQLLFYPAVMSTVMGIATSHPQSGACMGFYRTTQSISGIIAPSIGTFIYSQLSPVALWVSCAILTLVAALAFWRRQVAH